jgi:hypothetical protein
MAKINKLALVRLALRETLNQLDSRELLCVLTDLYTGGMIEGQPRWYGNGGGTSGLEQGIYNHMTTFRRVANLWGKTLALIGTDETKRKQETARIRDIVVEMLTNRGVNLKQIEETPNE